MSFCPFALPKDSIHGQPESTCFANVHHTEFGIRQVVCDLERITLILFSYAFSAASLSLNLKINEDKVNIKLKKMRGGELVKSQRSCHLLQSWRRMQHRFNQISKNIYMYLSYVSEAFNLSLYLVFLFPFPMIINSIISIKTIRIVKFWKALSQKSKLIYLRLNSNLWVPYNEK